MTFDELGVGDSFTFDRGSPWPKKPMLRLDRNAYLHYDGREIIVADKKAPVTIFYSLER